MNKTQKLGIQLLVAAWHRDECAGNAILRENTSAELMQMAGHIATWMTDAIKVTLQEEGVPEDQWETEFNEWVLKQLDK